MIDRRELILNELFGVLKTADVPTYGANVFRNKDNLTVRPSLLLLDGDENADERDQGRGRIISPNNLIVMLPEVYAIVADQKPSNETVGPMVNAKRAKIIGAVLRSAALIELAGPNGFIRYMGCVTDLAKGRGMDGEIGIQFGIGYVLRSEELA